MGKQSRAKRSDNGKGKVTPIQVAFIVDRYLSDNNFSKTRSVFRSEASSLISKSVIQEAPKTLLSLGAMLNEYICLKEEKVILDQERARFDQEKLRVQKLLHGMQDVMNAYNVSTPPTPMIQASATKPMKPMESTVAAPLSASYRGSPPGYVAPTAPTDIPSMPLNTPVSHNYSSPAVANYPLTRKRAGSNVRAVAPQAAKKSRNKVSSQKLQNNATQTKTAVVCQDVAQTSSAIELSPQNCAPSGTRIQGSNVVKNLFNQPAVPNTTNSPGPTTPPQPVSSQGDKSPLEENSSAAACSTNSTPQEITPNCTVVSSERVVVSPCKQMVYMERNHCISSCSPVKTNMKRPNMRDHVKGRLDFDGSDVPGNSDKQITNEVSTSESEKDADIFDLDFPNLDAFGPNFSFSELLVDLDIDCEGLGYACEPALDASMDNVSRSSSDSGTCNMEHDQFMSQYSSTVTEVVSGNDKNVQGPDTLTSVKSITKSITIISPAKSRRSSLDAENCLPN